MDWLYKFGDKVVEVGNAANDKARDLAELAKLSNKVRTYENDIQKIYAEIGKTVFDTRNDEDREQDFSEEFEKILNEKESIKNCKELINAIKGTTTCNVCGEEVDKDAYFCKKCGARMNQETASFDSQEYSESADDVYAEEQEERE